MFAPASPFKHRKRRVSEPRAFLRGAVLAFAALAGSAGAPGQASGPLLHGVVTDAQGKPLAGAAVRLEGKAAKGSETVTTDSDGSFHSSLRAGGPVFISVRDAGFQVLEGEFGTGRSGLELRLTALAAVQETINVTASIHNTTLSEPDPGQRVYVHEELLDANPGRPGAPISIPGIPIETASGGIKAPQYFVPGVAGDHGEPIAQYISVGGFLVPNNLSANAHGNGYADPNILVPPVLAGVRTDGGAFNVLEGNHSLNFAAAYELKPKLDRFATLTGDYRDLDLVIGLGPRDPQKAAWLAWEAAYGNGLLDRLEHRQQYKLNALRAWQLGSHTLQLFGIGYFGQSYIPGLVPIGASAGLRDTVDPRQRDQTHTGELAANDQWQLSASEQVSLGGMFRTYNLALDSNFGDGLIRQSEFRTVAALDASWSRQFSEHLALLLGADEDRDAPRRLELDHSTSLDPFTYGAFQKVAENNLTINDAAPYAAASGAALRYFRYYLGWRRDEVEVNDTDLVAAGNSFRHLDGVNNPKGTLSFLPPGRSLLPLASFSMGEAFFTNDPRIGSGAARGSSVERSHSAQLVLEKLLTQTDLKLTLGRTTTDQTLAKLDADTGLQEDEGPSKLRYLTALAAHSFSFGLLQASLSKADSRDLDSGEPTPEAPRTILDALGAVDRLPWGLQARGEFEYVGRKPLGDGFEAVPVKEFRGAVVKRFGPLPLELGINLLAARGYTGQTTEDLPAGWTLRSGPPGCPGTSPDCAAEETAVGVRLPSFLGASVSWRFGTHSRGSR